jgi:hypothetical protein
MPILEDAKRTIERVTGYRRPDAGDLGLLTHGPHIGQHDMLTDTHPTRDGLPDLTGADDDNYILHGLSFPDLGQILRVKYGLRIGPHKQDIL